MTYMQYYKSSKLWWQKVIKERTGLDVIVLHCFRLDDFSDYGCSFRTQDSGTIGHYRYYRNSIKWGI